MRRHTTELAVVGNPFDTTGRCAVFRRTAACGTTIFGVAVGCWRTPTTRSGILPTPGIGLIHPAEVAVQPGVRDAQVVAVPIQGQDRPVAFIVPEAGGVPDTTELIAKLRQSIANYKVPQRVWTLLAFPLTQGANGNKISRAQLRQMAQERLVAEAPAPQEHA